MISYRNDEGAPRSEDGLIWWGLTEWQDLEAAVAYARDQGAQSVVLYGYSMGGGIIFHFLEESSLTGLVVGAVLDAPVLDFESLVEFQAGRRNIPGPLVSVARQLASWRYDIDWNGMDYLQHVDRVKVPILLFHGDEDDRAPLAVTERLAGERPDIVQFVIGRGAGHVRTWNVDPLAYERAVRNFLTNTLMLQAP